MSETWKLLLELRKAQGKALKCLVLFDQLSKIQMMFIFTIIED